VLSVDGIRKYKTHPQAYALGTQATGLPAFAPGSGLDTASIGWRLTSALGTHWVAYGGVSALQLQGDAARSPLTTRRTVFGASVGLAYRSH